jgi:hypothetical protein
MTQRFYCRRRDDGTQLKGYKDDLDWWRNDGTCSYCGSLNPDRAMQLIEAGSQVCPTDKNYKIYLGDHAKVYFQHFSQSHVDRFITLYNAKQMRIAEPGFFYVRPFFAVAVQASETN